MYVDHQGKWIIFDSIDYPGLIDNLIFVYLQDDVMLNITCSTKYDNSKQTGFMSYYL